ncbi:ABC transporter permease [Microbacter sp. GSS18]|nr:ABC transporter permease [Microbacter sp. GSS18]
MNAAVRVEAMKLVRSRVGLIGSAAIVAGILALCGGMLLALAAGDPQLVAKLGPDASLTWAGLWSTAAQITSAGGLLAFGVVAAWLFGREFGDGTITGLFALPVGRGAIAAAKLIVFALWAAAVGTLLAGALLALGLIAGFGVPDAAAWAGAGRQIALGLFSAGLAVPAAWVATAARSLLGGVSVAIGLVVVAQVGVVAGADGWMPLAAPALWAISAGAAVSGVQLTVTLAFVALCAAGTVWWWHRLQLDR